MKKNIVQKKVSKIDYISSKNLTRFIFKIILGEFYGKKMFINSLTSYYQKQRKTTKKPRERYQNLSKKEKFD